MLLAIIEACKLRDTKDNNNKLRFQLAAAMATVKQKEKACS